MIKHRPHLLQMLRDTIFFSRFIVLLLLFLVREFFLFFGKIPVIGKIFQLITQFTDHFYNKIVGAIDTYKTGDISSSDLISLALRHLTAKKARTYITIGGMAIGIGAIVFLLSIGYGVQKLIISRVARLDEMKQIDVAVGQASSLSLDDQAVASFSQIENVKYVLPSVSIVGRVSYNNSVSDIVAYGVTSDFLRQSAIKPTKGKIFESDGNSLATALGEETGVVAGKSIDLASDAKVGKEIYQVRYSIHPQVWKAVYAGPDTSAPIIGYTKRTSSDIEATEVWGGTYPERDINLDGLDEFGNHYNRWLMDSFALWQKTDCDPNVPQCVDGKYSPLLVSGLQTIQQGFITETETTIDRYLIITEQQNKLSEGEVVKSVQFSLKPGGYFQVYDQPKTSAALVNQFTKLTNSGQLITGQLIIGETYPDNQSSYGQVAFNSNNQPLGYWVKARLPIWREVDCQNCEGLYLSDTELDNQGNEIQINQVVYIKASQVNFESFSPPIIGQVLGDSTSSATLVTAASGSAIPTTNIATASAEQLLREDEAFAGYNVIGEGLDWVEIASSSAGTTEEEKHVVPIPSSAIKQALANVAMLRLLGIPENEAIGQKISVIFILDSSLFKEDGYQAETEEAEYEIIGIIPEEDTPAFYVPFTDFVGTGVDNYSQMKVVVYEQNQLKDVRAVLGEMGYKTSSVVDTVGRINSLFNTIRIFLVLLGMIALGVAALGMFNTLTVSLLEKTREVGLMKAMGMKGHEVKRLFLAESIIISVIGGFLGIIVGFVAGKSFSIALSAIAVSKGQGFIDVAYIPFFLICIIIVLSFVIGLITGIFPARRATKISALNALRYE